MPHTHSHGLGSEHPLSHQIQFGSIIIFILCWIMDSFLLNLFSEIRNAIPLYLKIVLFVFTLAGGLYFMQKSQNIVFSAKSIVDESVYGIVRHPLYIGSLLLCFSLAFLTMSIISFIVLIPILFLYNMIMKYEEVELEKEFGNEYTQYKKKVARWIPKVF